MKVGPINGFNGFPVWYKDENDLRLQLNVDPADPFSGITPADLPDPSQPVSFPNNYPEEAFYYLAKSEMTTGTGERAMLVLALEAAFVNKVPIADEQIVFGRMSIRVDGLQPNAVYSVTHPFGINIFFALPDRDGFAVINFTEDIGGINGGDFHLALNSSVYPFLQWDPLVAPSAPEGYIGNPTVLHPIVGSLFIDRFGQLQNFFRIEGPRIGIGSPDRSTTPGIDADNCIETRNFTLLGKISPISDIDVTSTTKVSTSGLIDVFATSVDSAQNIEVNGSGIDSTLLQGDMDQFIAIPIANACPDQTVQQGTVVTLAGSATGEVTSYQWEQISGFPVLLNNANSPTATFTFPPQPATLSFRLTVRGSGGTSSDEVNIVSIPENLTVTRAEFRTGNAEWRISGTSDVLGHEVNISIFIGNVLGGPLLSQVSVDTLGEWEYRVEGSSVQPDETRVISIQSSSGGTLINVPLNIRT